MLIEIPVKSHVKKWACSSIFGPEPVDVRKNSLLGHLVLSVIENGIIDTFSTEDDESEAKTIELRLDGKTLVVPRNSTVGARIQTVLNQTLYNKSIEELEASDKGLKCCLLFGVDTLLLTPERLTRIGKQLEDYFNVALLMYCYGRMDVTPVINSAVLSFMKNYDITEAELKVDTAAKMVLRRRQKEMLLAKKPKKLESPK